MAMKHYNVKERLIEATIRVIAAEGMDKTTTKIIAKEAGLFETYIYQYFSNIFRVNLSKSESIN